MDAALTNYTVIKKEMLALIYAFDKVRSYVVCTIVVDYTDHATIRYLFNKKNSKLHLINGFNYSKSLTLRSRTEEVLKTRLQTTFQD